MCRTGQSRITAFGAGCGEKIERWTIAQKAERQVKFLRWRKLKPLNRFTKWRLIFQWQGSKKSYRWFSQNFDDKRAQRQNAYNSRIFQVHLELDTCDYIFTCFRDWIRPYRKATRKFLLSRVWEFWKWIPTVKLISLRTFLMFAACKTARLKNHVVPDMTHLLVILYCLMFLLIRRHDHSSLIRASGWYLSRGHLPPCDFHVKTSHHALLFLTTPRYRNIRTVWYFHQVIWTKKTHHQK